MKKGQKMSEETKRKIGLGNKGKKHSQEQIEKQRLSHLGKTPWNKGRKMDDYPQCGFQNDHKIILNEESRLKIGRTLKEQYKNGRRKYGFKRGHISYTKGLKFPNRKLPPPFTEEHKNKIRQNHSRYNLGRHHSEETRKKISIASRGQIRHEPSEKTKKKIGDANRGRRMSLENRLKISGKNANNWKGGVTPENKRIRHSIEFRLWRESVFARDNFTDQKTGIRGGKLHPHHILNFAQYPELRFAIDNGITLSEESHKQFHHIYGTKNNTREQLLEFLKS